MMRLSNIKRISDTVDKGDWKSPLADAVASRWGCVPGSSRMWRSSANHVFVTEYDGKRHWLRMNTIDERGLCDVESEVAVILWLAARGFRVSEPVPSLSGKHVETVETDLGTFNAVLLTHMEGEEWDTDTITPDRSRVWGQAMGKLHGAMKSLPKGLADRRPGWEDHFRLMDECIPLGDTELRAAMSEMRAWAQGLTQDPDDFGVIHFDFESDNIMWKDGEPGILDFDDSSRYWYVVDVVNAIRDLYGNRPSAMDPEEPRIKAFLEGYVCETRLNPALLREMPEFARMQALHRYARLARSVDTEDDSLAAMSCTSLRTRLLEIMDRERKSVLVS